MNGDRNRAAQAQWKILSLIVFFAVPVSLLPAQPASGRYWVEFRDRGAQAVNLQSVSPQSLGISERALWRRSKVLPKNQLIDERDLPVAKEYIDQLKARGVVIRAVSRWLNAVSVELSPQQLYSVSSLSFVSGVQPLLTGKVPYPELSPLPAPRSLQKQQVTFLNYGPSRTQLTTTKIVDLHAIGVIGSGVIVGMIDDGFNNHRTHNALKNINVIAEHDYIHNINDASRQPWEASGQGQHGAGTLSSIAGFDNGNLIGGAYGVSIMLAKTEMDSSGFNDFHIEEDLYVAALEWMEGLGVDIVSSSLGYISFTDGTSYSLAQLNGRIATTSKAARIAARKGVLLVTAMGNEGGYLNTKDGTYATGTLVAPADADSIVSVGAATETGLLAAFSGTGPTGDGRIKPEVVAQGTSIYWADGNNPPAGYWSVQGTSCSTPLTASTAALVLSAHPELTPMQVRNALMSSAVPSPFQTSQTLTYPNNFYGAGLIDALQATLYYGLVFSNRPIIEQKDSFYIATSWIKSKNPLIADSLFMYFKSAISTSFQRVQLFSNGTTNGFAAQVLKSTLDSASVCYFSARDNSGTVRTSPYDAPASSIPLFPTPDSVRVFYPSTGVSNRGSSIPQEFVLCPNYPNPFNGQTTVTFDSPSRASVELIVYNLLGQRIRTVFQGTVSAGTTTTSWDGRDNNGRTLPSGVYFYQLRTPISILTKSMLYLK